MIITQLNWNFKLSNRTGILRGKHNKYKMRVIEIMFLSIAILPRSSSCFYWDSLDKLAMDKDYLIKNNRRVEKAIEVAEKAVESRMMRIFNDENEKLRKINTELEERSITDSSDIRALKQTIRIVKAT